MPRLAVLAFLLLALSAARADVIHLTHGGRLVGRIVDETEDAVTIQLESGSMTLPRSRIREIERDGGAVGTRPAPGAPGKPETSGPRRSEAPAEGSVSLVDALERRSVRAVARGADLLWIELTLERRKETASRVYVAPGTMFEAPARGSAWESVQDMVCVSGVNVTLPEKGEVRVRVPVCSADLVGSIPMSIHGLRARRRSRSPDLQRLIPVVFREEATPLAQQAAVWIATNNASYLDLGRLSSLTGGDREILVHEAAQGMRLCERAGLDLSRKSIGGDDYVVVGALSDARVPRGDPLRSWAMERLRRCGYRGRTEGELVADVLSRGVGRRLLVVACDVAAQGRYPEAVGPLTELLARNEGRALPESDEDLSEHLRRDVVLDENEAVAIWAARALEAIGRSGGPGDGGGTAANGGVGAALEDCIEALKSGADSYRALRVLENLRVRLTSPALRRRAADQLIAFLKRTDGKHHDQLGRTLARYHDVLVPHDLAAAVEGKAPALRRVAARVLGEMDRPEAVRTLLTLLTDADDEVRREAASSLKGRQDAAEGLSGLVLHQDRKVREHVIDLLLELEGEETERALGQSLDSADPDRIESILDRLGELKSQAAAMSVAGVLRRHEDPEIRRLAAIALGRIGGSVARSWLLSAQATEKHRRVTREIERALYLIGED